MQLPEREGVAVAGEDQQDDVRRAVLAILMSKVADDRFPSVTMLNMIEDMMEPSDVPAYAQMLLSKVRRDLYPSIPMLKRLRALG
jgi:hypothetical protein